MPLILNGSTGISGTDGSAATPAVQGTDTNTGMFFPAADTIAFAEGGTEVMRIDASGNVGIGTSSPGARLAVAGSNAGGTLYAADLNNAPDVAGNGVGLRFQQNGNLTNYIRSRFTTEWGIDIGGTSDVARVTNGGLFQFNSGYGSVATAFGCRAWVNFNGQGTVAIRASGNVSSITDNGTGDYTVNFTNAMPDVNYSVTHWLTKDNELNDAVIFLRTTPASTYGTSGFRCYSSFRDSASFGNFDSPRITLAVFR